MPQLRNRKHEKFAQALALGCTQAEAGRRAGFAAGQGNKSYLSKLAAKVAERVAEIRRDTAIHQSFGNQKMPPNTSGKSLAELFPTSLIAELFQTILKKSVAIGDMKAATESVKNLQKMVEKENAQAEGGAPKTSGPAPTISMDNVIRLLDKMGEIAAPRHELSVSVPREVVNREVVNRAHRAADRDEQ